MDRHTVGWRGYIPAITTPFDQDGTLDKTKLIALVEWLLAEGMHGIIAAGSTGEWFSLDRESRHQLFHTIGATVKNRIPTIAGCSSFNTEGVIANATLARESGFDGILVTPPPYMVPSTRELLNFYQEVNAASPLPICIYNWPPGTNIDMPVALLAQLAELDKVVAIKQSTGDFRLFLDTFFALKDQVRVFGVPTNELGASLVVNHNADGLMGAAAVLGRDHPDFFNRLWEGKLEEALALGAKDRRLMKDWFNHDYTARFGSAAAVFKEALNVQGLPGGYPRKPILPVLPEHRQAICATLDALGKKLVYDSA